MRYTRISHEEKCHILRSAINEWCQNDEIINGEIRENLQRNPRYYDSFNFNDSPRHAHFAGNYAEEIVMRWCRLVLGKDRAFCISRKNFHALVKMAISEKEFEDKYSEWKGGA